MNPEHLTPEVRQQVSEAIAKLREIKNAENSNFKKTGRAFESDEKLQEFFNQYYEKVKDKVDNNIYAFLELCSLEDKYGFCSGYLGGATLNEDEDTVVNID